jgi:hypothetical protein
MTDILDFEIGNSGLGTTISFLSLFFHVNKPVIIRAPTNFKILREVKSVFDIPDEQLTIINQESIPNSITNTPIKYVSDYCKFWSPYFTTDKVNLFGKQYQTGKKYKPCIGVVTNNGWWVNEFPSNTLPFSRYYPKDFWIKIIDLILRSGYDVISLNGINVNLEQKSYLLNELCDAIIGSEGGVCHLAHVLKVPCIMMPWHHHEDGSYPHQDNTIFYAPQKMHIDSRTYFVKSEDEILSWDTDTFKEIIKKLHLSQGNNIFITDKLTVNTQNLSVTVDTQPAVNEAFLTEWEIDFIKTYMPNPTVGGL